MPLANLLVAPTNFKINKGCRLSQTQTKQHQRLSNVHGAVNFIADLWSYWSSYEILLRYRWRYESHIFLLCAFWRVFSFILLLSEAIAWLSKIITNLMLLPAVLHLLLFIVYHIEYNEYSLHSHQLPCLFTTNLFLGVCNNSHQL